jgi:predicted nucleic-acid-binding protein
LIGIDTNILVRYVLRDDVLQASKASRLIESLSEDRPGHITLVTVAELFWVLDRSYKLTRMQFAFILSSLIESLTLSFENENIVSEALDMFSRSTSADFSDCLITRGCIVNNCESIFTFDRNAAKAAGMTLLT